MHIDSTVNVVLKTTTLDKRLLYAINVAANSSNPLVKNTLEALIQGDWEFNMPKKGKNIRKQLKNYIQDEQVITQILQEIVNEAKKDPPKRNDDLMTDSLPQDINLRKLCIRRVAEKTTNLDMKAYLEKMFKNGPSFRKENFFKPCKIKDQELIRETWALLILEALELNQKSANKPKSKAAFTFWLEENNYSTTNKEEHCKIRGNGNCSCGVWYRCESTNRKFTRIVEYNEFECLYCIEQSLSTLLVV
uniref:Uncharacterized protein n=1 Tax=Acrobeloides nanus TaxID=290746 RepID=A0A914EFM7_9BILA